MYADGQQLVHFHTRMMSVNTLCQAASFGNLAGYYTFQLDQLPDYTEYTNMYEAYWIYKVVLIFTPRYTGCIPTLSNQDWCNARFYIVEDQNDSVFADSASTGRDYLMQYATCRTYPIMGGPFTMTVRPKPNTDGIENSNIRGSWITTASPSVTFHGAKYWMQNAAMDEGMGLLDCVAKFYLRFRSGH